MRGKFISLEGVDGAGKSTHLEWLANRVAAGGARVVITREPGGTPLGEEIRKLLLTRPMHLETETLLMFAARREHLETIILPALNSGAWVISDRFTDASFAYQGGGRGLDAKRIAVLEDWVQGGLRPDLTLYFDLPIEVARQRRAQAGADLDRFERENGDFFERVRAAYLARAAAEPQRIRVIDSRGSIDQIRNLLEQIVSSI